MKYFKWRDKHIERVQELSQQGQTAKEIADTMFKEIGVNLSQRSIRHYTSSKENIEQVVVNDKRRGTEIIINKDGSETSSTVLQMTSEQAKDQDYVLRAHGFDVNDWEIVSARNNFWQQNSVEKGLIDLYQSKITVKPRVENDIAKAIERLTNEVEPLKVRHEINPYRQNNLVVPLADMHFGILKLADIKSKLVELLDIINHGYKTIVIEVIGDTLHSDKINSTETVAGTVLEDVEMPSAIDEAMQFMETVVSAALLNANNVMIKSVGGNHDYDMSYMFMIWVKERFKQAKVDVNNNYRTAYLLDHVLISIQHGDVNKKIPGQILATEHRNMWGVATTAEIHTGHLHFDKTVDENGVVMRQFSTPKPSDNWEVKNGFVGANKLMYALVYDDERLKVEHFI